MTAGPPLRRIEEWARLARLELAPEEAGALERDLERILAHVREIQEGEPEEILSETGSPPPMRRKGEVITEATATPTEPRALGPDGSSAPSLGGCAEGEAALPARGEVPARTPLPSRGERADVTRPSVPRDLVLREARAVAEGYFLVPPVLETETLRKRRGRDREEP